MVMRRVLLCAAALFLLAPLLRAEDLRVSAKVDSSSVLVGDWVRLRVTVESRAGLAVEPPTLPDSVKGFEVVRRDTGAAEKNGDNLRRSYLFTLAAFDTGVQVVPAVVVRYHASGDTAAQLAQSSPIPVYVRGIAIDTTAEPKDVKPPLSVPLGWRDLLPYLIAAVVVAGAVWLFLYIRKRRARGESIIPTAPPRPAHELALEALRALESEHLWQRGRVKEYHSSVTDIVRTYIERSLGVIAMELTSEEILAAAPVARLENGNRSMLRELLLRADLVKFAKYQPSEHEHEAAMTTAVTFVTNTSRQAAETDAAEVAP